MDIDTIPRYEKVQMVLFGIILASLFFGYGFYALVQANCIIIGRGSPIGTFVTFYGVEARLLSTIYIGAGIWLFAGCLLRNTLISWIGAITLIFGLCTLIIILCLPLF